MPSPARVPGAGEHGDHALRLTPNRKPSPQLGTSFADAGTVQGLGVPLAELHAARSDQLSVRPAPRVDQGLSPLTTYSSPRRIHRWSIAATAPRSVATLRTIAQRVSSPIARNPANASSASTMVATTARRRRF